MAGFGLIGLLGIMVAADYVGLIKLDDSNIRNLNQIIEDYEND